MPATIEEFDAYMRGMLEGGDLCVTPEARELAVEIVMRPPAPRRVAPGGRAGQPDHGRPAAGGDPARVRVLAGIRRAALALAGGAEYVKRVVVPLLPDRLRRVA